MMYVVVACVRATCGVDHTRYYHEAGHDEASRLVTAGAPHGPAVRPPARNEESLGESVGDMARFHDLSDGPLLHNLRKARARLRDSAVGTRR